VLTNVGFRDARGGQARHNRRLQRTAPRPLNGNVSRRRTDAQEALPPIRHWRISVLMPASSFAARGVSGSSLGAEGGEAAGRGSLLLASPSLASYAVRLCQE